MPNYLFLDIDLAIARVDHNMGFDARMDNYWQNIRYKLVDYRDQLNTLDTNDHMAYKRLCVNFKRFMDRREWIPKL